MTLARRMDWVRYYGHLNLRSLERKEKQHAIVAISHTGYEPTPTSVKAVAFLLRSYRDPRQFVLSL